eukprot:CAMPEP_0196137226 /NCGR_PEP_ID=MMETSP0910-20130528/5279_1 /TAXON_ID=49265 /ORGANISM="Thalassiosira rotula, Strain GSO102" /LENGTH=772 /DNA_ID=CAMNT_0041397659 /DNA_START=80 /DNA_END=2398 /DNA_ORIENTATION=+
MNDPNDADEAAARRIQEQIWMAENDEDVDGGGGAGENNNNAGAVQDFVRQLLDRDNNNNNNNNNDNNNGGGGDNDNNDAENNNNDAAAAAAAAAAGGVDIEDDDIDEEDADAVENRRGAFDGGIAGEVRDEQQLKITRSLKCPLVLYFECNEDLDDILCPENPVLKKGTTVYIGLDKNTKLSLVFHQYCKFVNSKIPKRKGVAGSHNGANSNVVDSVKMSDFEFLHCTLLDENQTVEASAMMKNDRVMVCRERSRERAVRAEVLRQQRESDRKYFENLRELLPNPTPEGMGCDVVLDCLGKVVDERGFSQHVLATTVRANSVLISKRCKWLGQKISSAREDIRRRAEMTVPSDEEKRDLNEGEREMEDAAIIAEGQKSSQSEDEDDIIMAEPPVVRAGGDGSSIAGGDSSIGAAKVEDDEDDACIAEFKMIAKGRGTTRMVPESRLHSSSSSSRGNSIWVTLDHSPQAVKLLLEYCYTNRVQSLGLESFIKSSKFSNPKDKQSGPVTPFRKHEWPEGGLPTVGLHLALAGIALAEEAHVPRLSLMCEIAASQLVDNKNVIDVLGACQLQQQKTGNRLPLLRKAAMMDCIMANGSDGIDQLYANPNFRSNLDDRRGLVIPSLLDGTVEVMPVNMNTKDIRKKKDKKALETKKMFELHDKSDKNKRIMERMKWHKQSVVARRMEIAYGPYVDKTPSKQRAPKYDPNIWRDSYSRDGPPTLGRDPSAVGGGRGTKRKGGSSRSAADVGGGAAGGGARNVRRRQTRKQKNSLNNLA